MDKQTITVYRGARSLRVVQGIHEAHEGSGKDQVTVHPSLAAAMAFAPSDVQKVLERPEPTADEVVTHPEAPAGDAIGERNFQFEHADPADMEDELRERSESISGARDAAGYADCCPTDPPFVDSKPRARVSLENKLAVVMSEVLSDGSVAYNVRITGTTIEIGAYNQDHAHTIERAINAGAAWVTP